MKSTLFRRTAAITATLGAAVAGALVTITPPATAALTLTNYGFYGYAFGTSVKAQPVAVASGKTGFSFIGCTRLAGKHDTSTAAGVNVPSPNPSLVVGAIASNTSTFKSNGNVGTRSTDKIAKVVLGPADGTHLTLNGLSTKASAYADRNGKFHTTGHFALADLTAVGIPQLAPLNDATDNLFGQLSGILNSQPGNQIVIPGLGRIALGRSVQRIKPEVARSNQIALRITLFGANSVEGGGDDITVVVGRSHARIYRHMKAGVMGGAAYAAGANALNGVVKIDRLARQPLNCGGTNGKVVSNTIAGLDLGGTGQVVLGVAQGSAYGKKHADGRAVAWTRGRVADVVLGGPTGLHIQGVVGKATVKRSASGKITTSARGTQVASITANGTTYPIPKPGDVLEIPGIARIRFFIKQKPNHRTLTVTALRITLLDAAAASTGLVTIDLGVASTHIKRH